MAVDSMAAQPIGSGAGDTNNAVGANVHDVGGATNFDMGFAELGELSRNGVFGYSHKASVPVGSVGSFLRPSTSTRLEGGVRSSLPDGAMVTSPSLHGTAPLHGSVHPNFSASVPLVQMDVAMAPSKLPGAVWLPSSFAGARCFSPTISDVENSLLRFMTGDRLGSNGPPYSSFSRVAFGDIPTVQPLGTPHGFPPSLSGVGSTNCATKPQAPPSV